MARKRTQKRVVTEHVTLKMLVGCRRASQLERWHKQLVKAEKHTADELMEALFAVFEGTASRATKIEAAEILTSTHTYPYKRRYPDRIGAAILSHLEWAKESKDYASIVLNLYYQGNRREWTPLMGPWIEAILNEPQWRKLYGDGIVKHVVLRSKEAPSAEFIGGWGNVVRTSKYCMDRAAYEAIEALKALVTDTVFGRLCTEQLLSIATGKKVPEDRRCGALKALGPALVLYPEHVGAVADLWWETDKPELVVAIVEALAAVPQHPEAQAILLEACSYMRDLQRKSKYDFQYRQTREKAVEALAPMADKRAVRLELLAAAKDPNYSIAQEAIKGLAPYAADKTVRPAIKAAMFHPQSTVYSEAIGAAKKCAGDRYYRRALIKCLDSKDDYRRSNALEALEEHRHLPKVKEALLKQGEIERRNNDSYRLGIILGQLKGQTDEDGKLVLLLTRCLNHECSSRRKDAGKQMVARIKADRALLEPIMAFANGESPKRVEAPSVDGRVAAVKVLKSFKHLSRVRKTLLDLTEAEEAEVRKASAKALAPMVKKHQDIKDRMVELIGDQSDEVKLVAVKAIAPLLEIDPIIARIAKFALGSDDESLKSAGRKALQPANNDDDDDE